MMRSCTSNRSDATPRATGHKLLVAVMTVMLMNLGPLKGEPLESRAPAEMTIAAASDLKFAMDELIRQFGQIHSETKIKVAYGSSGNFFAQLNNGAPFDMFFSADNDYPQKLVEAGIAIPETRFIYGVGKIVVWVPHSSTLDLEKFGISVLTNRSIRKLAIANPKHAPYGKAAIAALKSLDLYPELEPRLVFGENISQTAQFVQSGSADAGIIALSLALAPELAKAGRYWEIPSAAYPKMEQSAVILKPAKNPHVARLFREFILGTTGRTVLKQYGFSLPEH